MSVSSSSGEIPGWRTHIQMRDRHGTQEQIASLLRDRDLDGTLVARQGAAFHQTLLLHMRQPASDCGMRHERRIAQLTNIHRTPLRGHQQDAPLLERDPDRLQTLSKLLIPLSDRGVQEIGKCIERIYGGFGLICPSSRGRMVVHECFLPAVLNAAPAAVTYPTSSAKLDGMAQVSAQCEQFPYGYNQTEETYIPRAIRFVRQTRRYILADALNAELSLP